METAKLEAFARKARETLMGIVANKLTLVLSAGSLERRESPKAISELEEAIKESGQEAVIEQVAYTWFNRFCALRFMDVNGYNDRIGRAVSAYDQHAIQPDILSNAKSGEFSEAVPENIRKRVTALLTGAAKSRDAEGESYRLLLVAACNYWHGAMPFLFSTIDDYTALLMPDDLLGSQSILAEIRQVMTPEACQDVEVIGWLYQYYIAPKKDAVYAGFKQNKKLTKENLPAATQLFTPHWIVSYLVQNSLGRLWMANHPDSRLVGKMPYYIAPNVNSHADTLTIGSPEEITVCDPACGSGHMLTVAFDLLYDIYHESGYQPSSIPSLILQKNLFGIEIDERAGELAAFALVMKAREKDRRFLEKDIKPNIRILRDCHVSEGDAAAYEQVVGQDIFSTGLKDTLAQFADARMYGSLIRPSIKDADTLLDILKAKNPGSDLYLKDTHQQVLDVLDQVRYLNRQYHVVVTNPPYMGGGNSSEAMKKWMANRYPDTKSNLFSAFMERGLDFAMSSGYMAMVTMQNWMFLSSFENLRKTLLSETTLLSMVHLGARAFDNIGGEVVQTTAFVLTNENHADNVGCYIRVTDNRNSMEKADAVRQAIQNPDCGWFYKASADQFATIPGTPIAYWIGDSIFNLFQNNPSMNDVGKTAAGLQTSDNKRFLRQWYEVSFKDIGFNCASCVDSAKTGLKWFPYNKGGEKRRWYGNQDFVINWKNDGTEVKNCIKAVMRNLSFHFKESISWSRTASSMFRYYPQGFIFDSQGMSYFPDNSQTTFISLGFVNSRLYSDLIEIVNGALSLQAGEVAKLPTITNLPSEMDESVRACIATAKADWDSQELSWGFTANPLCAIAARLLANGESVLLSDVIENYMLDWQRKAAEQQAREVQHNVWVNAAAGVEMATEVPLSEITLFNNPAFQFEGKTPEEQKALFRQFLVKQLVSYAVGCMFGRYSLDKPGLILASQSETLADFRERVPNTSFPVDPDNILPVLDDEWFEDDIVGRFRQFIAIAFGEQHYSENLDCVETALGMGKKYSVRDYFVRDFYKDHLQMTGNRPFYWLFSSPKGHFNALVYLHRYTPDLLSRLNTDYVQDFRRKLEDKQAYQNRIVESTSASKRDKTAATKQSQRLSGMIVDIEDYEFRLHPFATQRTSIDLDDGVVKNYRIFEKVLKPVKQLAAKD